MPTSHEIAFASHRPTEAMRWFRRGRFLALRWLLSKTHTGRAVLWNEWLNGQEFERKIQRFDSEFVPNCDTEGL